MKTTRHRSHLFIYHYKLYNQRCQHWKGKLHQQCDAGARWLDGVLGLDSTQSDASSGSESGVHPAL